jgi:hypothetical protein
MSSVSQDNQALTQRVAHVVALYSGFQKSLVGQVVEVLAGMGSGVFTLLTMNNKLEQMGRTASEQLRLAISMDLDELSERALATSKAEPDASISSTAVAVSQTLSRGFEAELMGVVSRLTARDVRTATEFVRIQMSQGRFTASSAQLFEDIQFTTPDKAGRQIKTDDYMSREVNWAYRQHYNTIMVHVMLAGDAEKARVDGGSGDGTEIDLMQYDQVQAKYFHHNSKSLLQPLD